MTFTTRGKTPVRKKIIYTDDVNFNLVLIKNALKDLYEVFPAPSVAVLFDILKHVTPDLIMLDLNMPGVDGYEAITRLKNVGGYADIPIIVITAADNPDDRVKSLSRGADAYLSKPFTTEHLLETITETLDHQKVKNIQPHFIPNDKRRIILAVDDAPSILKAIYYALRELYRVFTLSDPNELLNFLNSIRPDFFILDYMMPIIDGFDLLQIIRSYPEHSETPIIFLTSVGTASHLTEAVRLGACDYMVKPFDTKTLRAKIETHIKSN